jgi:hypothetical protein
VQRLRPPRGYFVCCFAGVTDDAYDHRPALGEFYRVLDEVKDDLLKPVRVAIT